MKKFNKHIEIEDRYETGYHDELRERRRQKRMKNMLRSKAHNFDEYED